MKTGIHSTDAFEDVHYSADGLVREVVIRESLFQCRYDIVRVASYRGITDLKSSELIHLGKRYLYPLNPTRYVEYQNQ